MPKLEELYLANNSINSFAGYEGLPVLKILHLRRNKIEKFDEELPELPALTYINLRSNKIASMEALIKVF
jgi:Leucine-rich repeat (LRR) protein